MRDRRWSRHPRCRLLLASTAALGLACGGGAELTAPTTGSIQVTTSTTGAELDPDGYRLTLNDVDVQAIGVAAEATLTELTPGPHRIGLTGVAPNCTVQGDNPRFVTVVAGETASEAIAVVCAEGPPATGTLEVTTTSTGTPEDPSGYTVSLDGGDAVAIGVNATRSFDGLSPGTHSVELGGLADNCAVQGQNPRSAAVTASQTTTLSFAVVCSTTTGSLTVTVGGLPGGADAAVTVTGPDAYHAELTATGTIAGLVPGQYTVSAASVSSGGTTYTASPEDIEVAVSAGATAQVTIIYAGPAPSLNLRVAGFYFTQSVQRFDNDVPLVAGRDAFLRVFAQADQSNTETPSVRVRLYHGSAVVQTFTIPAPADTVPTGRTDGDLGTTWNVLVPGSLIQPGLGALADVDPTGAIAETDESDNAFPTSGGRRAVSVRVMPPLAITLVPVRQSANQLQGDVTPANSDQYLDLTRRVFPLPGYGVEVHPVYTTDTDEPLLPDDANGGWITVLGEIAALRLVEDSERHYYGVVRTGYSSGMVGRGFIGLPVAIGYDEPADRSRITAHELGHTWNRLHAPCGGPPDADPNYPYPGANIGRFGYDLEAQVLKPRDTPDLMSYCGDPWISDYTYEGVMDFRETESGGATAGRARLSLLVWGRIVNRRAVLEPAFQIVSHPVLPRRPGPYSIQGVARDGSRVFDLSFDAVEVADDARGARHFAFIVPFDEARASRLESLHLAGPGVSSAAVTRAPPSLRATPAPPAALARVAGGRALWWDAAAHPMVMVRDARTGEVLSFARGGNVLLPASGNDVELVMSDGVRSRSVQMR